MLKNYLKIAWRNLLRQKLFSLINIGGLSVAMTAAVLIMMWGQNEWSFDGYHPAAERVYLVKNYMKTNSSDTWITENSPYPLYNALESQIPETELVTHGKRTQRNELVLRLNDKVFTQEWGLYVDRNWFKVFRYEFIEGGPRMFFNHPYSLVLTASKARKLFGKTNVTGRSLRIDSTEYTVQGVVKDNPVNSSLEFDLLMPMTSQLSIKGILSTSYIWRYPTHKTFLRLREGADPEKVADKITGIYRANREENNLRASLLPLKGLRFDGELERSAFKHVDSKTVKLFSLLAILLLVTASINYVNLSVARAGLRSKELGIRKVAGAARKTLFFQLMTESVLTSLLALAATMLLVSVCLPYFNAFTGIEFTFNPLEPHLALLLSGTLIGVIVLTGTYPAVLLSSFNPVSLFRGKSLFHLRDSVLRKGLVVGQFALAVVMTIAAITIYKQLSFIQQQKVGYDRSQVFTVQIPSREEWTGAQNLEEFQRIREKRWGYLQLIKQELQSQARIKQVAATGNRSVINANFVTSGSLDWDGRDPDFHPSHATFAVDADLNKIMNWTIVKGRWFEKNNISDENNVILNETAVREFGLREPVIGRRFDLYDEGRIVGVVKDFYHKSLREKTDPVVICMKPSLSKFFLIESQEGNVTEALHVAEAVMHRHFPHKPFIYRFLDEEFEQLYRDDQKALSFTMVFSGLSILISCLGLLGMAVFSIQQRNKEIGIRKVLGASVAGVVALLSKDFVKLVLIAILIATPLAWYAMNRWLEDFAYRIELQWWMFALAGILAVVIAVLTVSFQSVRAALANPVKSLRSD